MDRSADAGRRLLGRDRTRSGRYLAVGLVAVLGLLVVHLAAMRVGRWVDGLAAGGLLLAAGVLVARGDAGQGRAAVLAALAVVPLAGWLEGSVAASLLGPAALLAVVAGSALVAARNDGIAVPAVLGATAMLALGAVQWVSPGIPERTLADVFGPAVVAGVLLGVPAGLLGYLLGRGLLRLGE